MYYVSSKIGNCDLATKTASVAYYTERTDISTIEKTISSLGYQANEITADPNAYESLPGCCKIGGMDKMWSCVHPFDQCAQKIVYQ